MHRLTILAATAVLLSLAAGARADTITLHPTGAGSIADWQTSDCPGTEWDCLNDNAGNAGSGAPAANDGDTTKLRDPDGFTGRVMVAALGLRFSIDTRTVSVFPRLMTAGVAMLTRRIADTCRLFAGSAHRPA